MAKVLPAGANVNLGLGKDPMDRLVQTVDLAMKVGGAFQKNQDRRRTNSSNEMSDLMTMLTNGSQYLSGDDYQKIGNQIKNATSSARSIGTPTLTTQANLLENVHESMSQSNTEYENSLLTFNNDFMNLDIFNQSNYTDADGNPNMEFLNEINAKGIDWFNETQSKLSNYQRQLFTVGGNGELIPKRNNQASRKAQADYQKTQNMFYNLYDSRLNNVISEDEFVYIAQNGGLTNKSLDNFRQGVLENATSRINNLERSITSNNKLTSSLKTKKTDKLRIALKDTDDGENAWILNYLEENKDTSDTELNQALDEYTAQDYEDVEKNGGFVGADGEFEEMPEKIKRVYDSLIAEANSTSISLNTEYDQLRTRFDFWSPFTWDSKNSASIISPGSIESQFKIDSTEETSEAVEMLLAQQSTEEAPDEETTKEDLAELENKDDFKKLGINISGNLTKSNVERIKAELMEIFNNSNSDTNFVKLQSLKRANDAINKIVPKDSVERLALNEKQLKQAEPKFKAFQKETKNQIALITEEINSKKTQMNQMTSFNRESLKKQKNIIANKIKTLENRLEKQQNLLKNTDINTWLSTIANKYAVEQIKTGESNAQLAQNYLDE